MLRFITAIWKLMCKGEIQPLQSMLSWEKDLPIIKGGVGTEKSFIIIICVIHAISRRKAAEIHSLCEPLSFKEEVPLQILLFVCCFLNQSCVSCSESGELRDRQRSNALRNFWLVHFLKFNNNIADDCNTCFITDVRENLHSLTNWFHNKTHTHKKS